MFPGDRSSLLFSGFGLKILPLVFSLILTLASRLLHLYRTDDKISRLMMKRFSTVRDTQRVSQSYMEKRRGRREIQVTRRKRGGIKKRENKLASNHFPMCSPQSGTLRDVHGFTQKREEGGMRQVTMRGKGGIKRREIDPASNLFPKCSPQPRTHKEIHRIGEGDIEATWWRKEYQKGREKSSQ